MEDSEKTLTLATKFKCHKYIINYHITQKDKISLLNYKCNLNPQSQEYIVLEDALKSTVSDSKLFVICYELITHNLNIIYYFQNIKWRK